MGQNKTKNCASSSKKPQQECCIYCVYKVLTTYCESVCVCTCACVRMKMCMNVWMQTLCVCVCMCFTVYMFMSDLFSL